MANLSALNREQLLPSLGKWLVLLLIGFLACVPATVFAQTPEVQPPPDSLASSPFGVDMVTGTYRDEMTDLSIGDPTKGGIEYKRASAKLDTALVRTNNWLYRIKEVVPSPKTGCGSFPGCNTTANVSLTSMGISKTWVSYNDGEPPYIETGARTEGVSKLEKNAAGEFVFTSTDGTIIEFDAPSSNVSYARKLTQPDGIIYTISYANGMRIKSNVGYQLIVEADGLKACVLNAAITSPPASNVCPAGVQSVQYSANSTGTWSKTDSLGGVTSRVTSNGTTSLTRPGDSQPWMTITTAQEDGFWLIPTVQQQSFTGGPTVDYGYTELYVYETEPPSIPPAMYGRGTSWTVNGTATTNLTWGIDDSFTNYPAPPPRVTPGPTVVTDALGRQTLTEYNGGPYPYTTIKARVSPSQVRQDFTYGVGGTITNLTTTPKPGSPPALQPIAVNYVHDCTYDVTCTKPQSATDARGNTTDYIWSNTHGGMLTETAPADASGIRAKKTYNWQQYTASWNGGSGTVWLIQSISQCATQAVCTGTADEVKTVFTYDTSHNLLPLTQTVQLGDGSQSLTTSWTYNDAGDKLSEDGPLAGAADTKYWRYDVMRRVTGEISPDPDGSGTLQRLATRTTYDAAGRPIKVEAGELSTWKSEAVAPSAWGSSFTVLSSVVSTYDIQGRKLTEAVKGSNGVAVGLTQYSYDAVGRLECTAIRMNPAAYGSLPSDACTLGATGTDGPDRITKMIYDAAGQVLQVRKAVGTSDEIADVTYSYTDNGNIEYVIDANGNKAKLEYDGFDRQSKWVFPSKTRPSSYNPSTPATAMTTAGSINTGDYEQYTYDANGNRTSLRKRDGRKIAFTYDALNRVTKKDLCSSGTASCSALASVHRRDVFYAYDLRGLQTKARFGSIGGIGITYAYDGFGRLTSETQNSDGATRTVSSQYDANGNRTRLTHPDGKYFQLTFDGLNRATTLKQLTTTLGAVSFNNRGLPSQLAWTYATSSANKRTFGYDAAGRMSSLGLDLNSTSRDATWTYTRNAASQIKTEITSSNAYAWDGHVNVSRSYTTNGLNQYTSAGGANFCYDANGNLTADGSSVYLYDVENRLVQKRVQTNTNCASLSYSGTLQAELRYDPTGRLYQVHGGALGTQRFAYDGNAMIAEYNSAGTMLRRYVHGSNVEADDPLIWYEGSVVSNATRRYVHADPRGSIVAVTNYTGTSIATNSYDEYGIPDTSSGTDITTKGRFRYTGQAWIPELGMYYYKARIYSPTLGRFLQTDPIGYEDNVNLYAYVANDPVNLTDPTGTCAGPAIIPCAIAAEKAGEAIVIGAAGLAALCVAYCPSPEDVKETIDQFIDKGTPDPVLETTTAPAPRGGTRSEAKSKKPPKRAGDSNRKGHGKGARGSTRPRHEDGDATGRRDRDGEKGDNRRRPPRKPPGGKTPKGGWPPKKKEF